MTVKIHFNKNKYELKVTSDFEDDLSESDMKIYICNRQTRS